MEGWVKDVVMIGGAALLVLINGFFVAVEFSLVKLRESRLNDLVKNKRPFAETASWLQKRLDASLSACQLGITMASLGLGWVGEPAVAHLIRPLLLMMGISTEIWLHGIAFFIAFTSITAAHLVIGEQAPKIFALRRSETVALWGAVPLKIFYFLTYPLMVALNASTDFLLKRAGIDPSETHQDVPSEAELRVLLQQARTHGYLSRSEHRLINAAFEFDDLVCRKVMQPRMDVLYFDLDRSNREIIDFARTGNHSRYPLCRGSLDNVLGFVHIKDLVGMSASEDFDLLSILRPPQFVPETIPISKLLRQFQSSHQHIAFVIDEYGSVAGIITLEDIIEQIVGPVEDEFDHIEPDIVPCDPGGCIVLGNVHVDRVNLAMTLKLDTGLADTLSGYVMAVSGQILSKGDRVELPGAVAEVLEISGNRAKKIRITPLELKAAPALAPVDNTGRPGPG
jgi:CBS domain containing-hemolysin-like protein